MATAHDDHAPVPTQPRVLIAGEPPDDAALMIRALRIAGLEPDATRVDSEPSMRAALQDGSWDVVLYGFALPGFDRAVLEYLGRTYPKIPVIAVGGRIGKAATARLLKAGARHYVTKNSLSQLAPTVVPVLDWDDARRSQWQAEQAHRVSGVRYRRLFEAAQDGILILDADTGEILDVNPFMETLLGYTRAEYLGKSLWEIGPFKDIAASKAAFAELQERRSIRYEDLPLQTKDGRVAEVEFVSNVYAEDRQNVIQCNIRDISARKAAKTLSETSRMAAAGDLTGGLAHDFNNLLMIVIGNLGLLLSNRPDDADVQEFANEALDAARRGAALTRGLLAFAHR